MKKHIMIGSLICVATVLIFLVFWGKLPSDVPIHFDSNGNVNSVLPKTAVVFGTPAICAILNVFCFDEKERRKNIYVLFNSSYFYYCGSSNIGVGIIKILRNIQNVMIEEWKFIFLLLI